MRQAWWVVAAAWMGGCGAEFTLTAPDLAGLPGKTSSVVVRLRRSEFWRYSPASRGAAITFRLPDGTVRSAGTDDAGYAAVSIDLPASPGRYEIALYHQDALGDAVSGTAAAYVLLPDTPTAAVDADSLPFFGRKASEAAAAVSRLTAYVQIVYTSQDHVGQPAQVHRLLARAGYPDGPILPYVKVSKWPSLMRPRRPPDLRALQALKESLPDLRWGVAADDDAARTFRQAGLKTLAVSDASARRHADEFFRTWSELRLPPGRF
jgi:hypothetical protein